MEQLTPTIEYTVPPTVEKWLEATQALHALIVDEHERLRQRRSEIAAIRRDLERLRRDCGLMVHALCQTWREQVSAEPRVELTKYNPDEPRVPAGHPDGGEWTSEDGDGALSNPPSPQYAANDPPGRFPPPPPGNDPKTCKQGKIRRATSTRSGGQHLHGSSRGRHPLATLGQAGQRWRR
jgi:hypothetical protein